MGSDEPISGQRLLDICHIHLAYIGQQMYGELKCRPFTTMPGLMITGSPTQGIPPSDETECSVTAVDLTTEKHIDNNPMDTTSDENSDSVTEIHASMDYTPNPTDCADDFASKTTTNTTTTADPDNTSAGIPASISIETSDESDTLSESLLNPIPKPMNHHILGTNRSSPINIT